MPTKADYEAEAKELYDEIYRLAFEETGWTLKKKTKKLDIYTVKTPYCDKCPCYKVEIVIKMSPERVIDTINPFGPYRRQYDPYLLNVELFEEINPDTAVAYKVYEPKNLGSLSRKADGIDLLHYGANEKFHYAMCKGTSYDDRGYSVGHRTVSFPVGAFVIPTENPNECKGIFLYHVDINAPKIVPTPLIEKLTCLSLCLYFDNFKSMINKPYERLDSSVPFCRNR